MKKYAAFHWRSIEDREALWLEQVRLIHGCGDSRAPCLARRGHRRQIDKLRVKQPKFIDESGLRSP